MSLLIKSIAFKLCTLAAVPIVLSGCLGGSVAQQLVSSILMHGADQATAAAMNAQERSDKIAARNTLLRNAEPDELHLFLFNSGFQSAEISTQPHIEPLPAVQLDAETPINIIQESKLVSVEVWNLLIGDEKLHLLEKARLQGSTAIPPEEEWPRWQIAVGAFSEQRPENKEHAIIFLIPPDVGKMRTGNKALIELSNPGGLNIARYALN